MTNTILEALAGASLLALAVPAYAQVTPAEQTPAAPVASGATESNTTAARADDASPAADSTAPGDIIVTATRRAERLQDVPVAVSAITGDQLAESGFQNLQDIQYQFSGVQFGTSPNDAGFRLRGVGSAGGFSSSSEQNVGTVVDNVVIPFGNPVGSIGDLDRVEVLKGPQGTQFGKNASSGVVNITTRRPDLNTYGGSLFASYAELNEHNVQGSINVPINGIAGLSLFAYHRGYDDFVDNVVLKRGWGGTKNYGFRGKLLIEPTDDFSVYIIGDYSKSHQNGPGQLWTLNRVPVSANPIVGARYGAAAALGVTPGFNNERSAEDTDANINDKNWGFSVEVNKGLGDYNLTSVTAYRRLEQGATNFGIDGFPFPIFFVSDNRIDNSFVSQELRLTSPSGSPFEYIGGVYLSRLNTGISGLAGSGSYAILRPALPFSASPQIAANNGITYTGTQSESAAGFVDGRFHLGSAFSLLGGLRLQYDNVTARSFSVVNPAYPPFVGPNGFTIPYSPRALARGRTNKTDYSGRAGFEYKPSADILLFGTIARGYLGPTVTFSGLTGAQVQVEPQTVRDITVGAKTQFLDRRLTVNGNIFFDKYKNLQTSVFNGLEFLTENAGGFRANGFEIDTNFRFSPRFAINGSFTYSDTKFTDYVTACPANIVEAGTTATRCNAPGSTAGTALFQAAGEPLNGAPKYSVTAGADFNQPIGDTLKLDASLNYYYRSRVQYDVGNPNHAQGGYSLVGGTVGLGSADGKYRLAVFARNLFDKKFQSSVIGLPFTDADATVNWNTREGRRTIGVSGEVRF